MEFMNKFEAVIILNPDISNSIRDSLVKNFLKLIESSEGNLISSEDWGLRDLSYKIGNSSKAFYNFFQLEIDGNKIENIKKILTQDENFIRHLFVKVNFHQELPTKLNYEKK
jgi:small subunit ribosomal protein S6